MKFLIIILITVVIGSCTKGGKLDGVHGITYAVTSSATSKQLVPAIDTTATASFSGLYDETTNILTSTITWSDLWLDTKKDTITSIGIYGPATATTNGPLVRTLSFVSTNRAGSANLGLAGNTGFSDQEKSDFMSGAWYFTINTKRYTAGIVRGQLTCTQK
jgi:CHRD domain-containing protein